MHWHSQECPRILENRPQVSEQSKQAFILLASMSFEPLWESHWSAGRISLDQMAEYSSRRFHCLTTGIDPANDVRRPQEETHQNIPPCACILPKRGKPSIPRWICRRTSYVLIGIFWRSQWLIIDRKQKKWKKKEWQIRKPCRGSSFVKVLQSACFGDDSFWLLALILFVCARKFNSLWALHVIHINSSKNKRSAQ